MRIDKDNIKIVLILLVVALGIGYSYLNTELNINGTANINSANWNVYWNNVQVSNGSVEATTPTIDTGKTTVSFNVTLTKPGDYYEFTVDAVNAGTLDAMIESISSKLNGTTITTLPAYLDYNVTYSDGMPLQPNQELLHDSTETYKVSLAYKDNISVSDLPGTEQTLNLSFSVTYKQADENSQTITHNIRYVYGFHTTFNDIGQPLDDDIVLYDTVEDLRASGDNTPFYIKHKLEDNIVLESYIEFVITPEMASANSGMTPGTYVLIGGHELDYDNSAQKYTCDSEYYDSSTNMCKVPEYETNKNTLLKAFGSSNCTTDSYDSREDYMCEISNISASAYTIGGGCASISEEEGFFECCVSVGAFCE